MKGMQNMRRRQTNHPFSAHSPAAIKQDLTATPETREQICPAKIGPDHFVRMSRIRDPDVSNVVPPERRTLLRAHDPLMRLATHRVCFR